MEISEHDLARARAERFLAHRVLGPLHDPPPVPPGLDPELPERQRAATIDGALDVYERLGLFTPDEVSKWRDASAATRGVVPPAGSSPSAVRMLERRWAEVESAVGDEEAVTAALMRFGIAQMAAGSAGLLSAEDGRAWMRLPEDRSAVTPEERRRLELSRSARLRNLLVVIPGPATRASGVTLTSIEAFEDALVVNWRRMVEGDGEQPFLGFGQASLTDDVGTDYVSFGGGGGGSTEQYGTIVFGPAPPKAATTLELQIADDAFRVDLSARTVA